jgi:hypothetical protein
MESTSLSNLVANGTWELYVRSGQVTATIEGPLVILQNNGHVWQMSPRSFALCYVPVPDAQGQYVPVKRAIWACRVVRGGQLGAQNIAAGDYVVTWADEGVDGETLKRGPLSTSLDVWVVDQRVFALRYTKHNPNASTEATTSDVTSAVAAPVTTAPISGAVVCGAASLQGERDENEDTHLVIANWTEDVALFGVFDGHGGSDASTYCAKKLPAMLHEQIEDLNADPEKSMQVVLIIPVGFSCTLSNSS